MSFVVVSKLCFNKQNPFLYKRLLIKNESEEPCWVVEGKVYIRPKLLSLMT